MVPMVVLGELRGQEVTKSGATCDEDTVRMTMYICMWCIYVHNDPNSRSHYGLEKNDLDGKLATEGGSGTTLTVAHVDAHALHDTDQQTEAINTPVLPSSKARREYAAHLWWRQKTP